MPSIAREEQQIEQRRALRAALGGQATAAKVELTLERLEHADAYASSLLQLDSELHAAGERVCKAIKACHPLRTVVQRIYSLFGGERTQFVGKHVIATASHGGY